MDRLVGGPLEHGREQARGDQHPGGPNGSQLAQKPPCPEVDRLAQAPLLFGLSRLFVLDVGRAHAGVGHQHPLQPVQDDQKGPLVEHPEQLILALREGPLAHLLGRLARQVGQGADHKVLVGGVGLIKAPPEAPVQRFFADELLWGDFLKPVPREGRLALPADGDHAKEPGMVDRFGPRDPVGQAVQLLAATDEASSRAQERELVGDVGLRGGGNSDPRVEASRRGQRRLGAGCLLGL